MNVRYLIAYFKERFPLINMMLFGIMFFTVYSVANYYNAASYSAFNVILGIITINSFFFRLRVFDEMKDYAIDVVNHPNRVLQSGKVTLKVLATVAMQFLVLEVAWTTLGGLETFFFWSMAVGYSLLMRYEFFIGNFLKKYLLLYSFLHMLIMPLIIIWIWSGYSSGFQLSVPLLLLCLLSILGGFSFELARKIHAPSAERATVDSYSKSIGFIGSVICVCLVLLAGIISQFYLLNLLQTNSWPYILLALLYIVTITFYFLAIKQKQEKQFRTAEKFVSLFMLFSYLSIIIEIQLK